MAGKQVPYQSYDADSANLVHLRNQITVLSGTGNTLLALIPASLFTYVVDWMMVNHDATPTGSPTINFVVVPVGSTVASIVTTPANGRSLGTLALAAGTKLANNIINPGALDEMSVRRVKPGEMIAIIITAAGAWTLNASSGICTTEILSRRINL